MSDGAVSSLFKGGLTPWIKRRARNARHRRSLLAAVTAPVAVVSLAVFLFIPHSARRAAREMVPRTEQRPDTAALRRALGGATTRLAATDDALAKGRAALEQWARAIAQPDTQSAEQRARRALLATGSANLTRRLQRVESAPLPASYRALGEAPELRGDSAIKPLLDSLTALEKSREAFGATGGVDPVFIALTARVSEIGEAIQQRAEARRLAMRTELARLGPAPAPVPLTRPTVDTVPLAAARDSAVRAVAQARTALSRAKALHRALDDSIAQANRVASVGASFPAMFGAALVIGLAIAFAVAFVDEGRRPRVSDITEAESAADAKVLARVRMPSNPPERTRRRADREVSPLIERKGESYEALHSQLSRSPGMNPLVITGDEPEVSAIVAANLASASAHRARTTLLIDLDLEERSLAGVLRMPSAPGMADLVSSGADWPALVRQVLVGRDRSIDVIPSGHFEAEEISDVLLQQLWRDLTHMRGRYDAVILHVPQPKAGVLRLLGRLSAPVVVCCRMAGTYLDQLGAMTDSIREAGAPVSGIIAWESDLPILAVSSLTPTTPMRVVAGVSE